MTTLAINAAIAEKLGWTKLEIREWWTEVWDDSYTYRGLIGWPPGANVEVEVPDYVHDPCVCLKAIAKIDPALRIQLEGQGAEWKLTLVDVEGTRLMTAGTLAKAAVDALIFLTIPTTFMQHLDGQGFKEWVEP